MGAALSNVSAKREELFVTTKFAGFWSEAESCVTNTNAVEPLKESLAKVSLTMLMKLLSVIVSS